MGPCLFGTAAQLLHEHLGTVKSGVWRQSWRESTGARCV